MSKAPRRLTPLWGIVTFILIMLIFLLVFAPLQYFFGMIGLALTELGLLGATLLAVRISGQRFSEVFPLRRPTFSQLLGTILLWGGCFLSVTLSTVILMYFFPEGFLDVSSSLQSVFMSVPAPVGFLIVAVMPAVCEEAMHRGFIQYTFRSVRRDWIVVLCMGLIFGIFHMDPYRFLPTALLGMGLSYIMQKTHNLFLPALFHFINNSLSFFSSLGTSAEDAAASVWLLSDPSVMLLSIGSYLMAGSLAPILLFAGVHFLKKGSGIQSRRSDARTVVSVLLVLGLSGILFLAGIAIMIMNIGNMPNLSSFL